MKIFFSIFILTIYAQQTFSFGLFKPVKQANESYQEGPVSVDSTSYAFESGSCGNVPSKVVGAYREAKSFSQTCATAKIAPGKLIAVNDYSGDGTPTMYIMDQSGRCLKSVPISWGAGNSRTGKLRGCSSENSKMTPPGMHITMRHEYGSRYSSGNSIGLAGLCGQNSLGARGILIHPSKSQGTPSSWGCTGVPANEFLSIKQELGVGSLVYNFFGDQPQECSDPAGFTNNCAPEPLAVKAAQESQGGRIRYRYQPSGSSPSDNQEPSGVQ